MKYSDIFVQPLHDSKYKIKKEIHYKDIVVPIGYRTNGADIPRWVWSYIPPNWSDSLPAVIVHDYMCDRAETREEYEKADLYLKEILEILKVKKSKAKMMSGAVSLYTKYVRKYQEDK